MTEPRRIDEKTRERALIFLMRFNIALKIAKVYEANNRLFLDQVEPLFRALVLILHESGEAVFAFRGKSIFFNRSRLEFDLGNTHIFRALAGEFAARRVGSASFGDGITREEVGRFVSLLANSEIAGDDDPFERLEAALAGSPGRHIALEKARAEDTASNPEREAAKVYYLGILMLRDFYDKQKRSAGISLVVPRRWVESLIEQMAEEEDFLFGLLSLKNTEGYIPNHGVNVAILALSLGRRLGLSRRELLDLGVGALLHNLGTLDVSPAILDKPSKLSDAEKKTMALQETLGARRLLPSEIGREVPVKALEVVMEHRLRADLTNIPPHLRRTSIHLFGKIVKIADAYDALTTRRVYRTLAYAPDAAIAMMQAKSGAEFDPLLLKAFAAMLGPYPIGTFVALTSGELGIVVERNPQPSFAARPCVQLVTDAEGRRIDGPVADLTEADPSTKRFRRTIVQSLNPGRYGIRVSDYFRRLAQR